MRQFFFLFICCGMLCAFSSRAQQKKALDLYTLDQFRQRVIQPDNDTLYVVNFWATWCGPCVRELPHFKALSEHYEKTGKAVKFILMSLDPQSNAAPAAAFLDKKKITIEAHLFAAGDPNVWINELEPSWEGSIPATFLYQKGSKISFREAYFSDKNELNLFINNHK